METVIRRAVMEDAEELAKLGERTFIETYHDKVKRVPGLVELYARETFALENVQQMLTSPERESWVCWVESELVGFLQLSTKQPPACVTAPNLLHVERLYLLAAYQGRGLGLALMKKAEERASARKYAGMWLGVMVENVSAIQFYLRQGFKKVGSHPWDCMYQGERYVDLDDVMLKIFK